MVNSERLRKKNTSEKDLIAFYRIYGLVDLLVFKQLPSLRIYSVGHSGFKGIILVYQVICISGIFADD